MSPFPTSGRQALPALDPDFQTDQFKAVDEQKLQLIQLFQDLEREKWQRRSDGQYPVFISLRDNPDQEQQFSYHRVYLSFSEKQLAEAGGEERFMIYRIPGLDDKEAVFFAGLLPDNHEVLTAVRKAICHRFITEGFSQDSDTLQTGREQSGKAADQLPILLEGNCLNVQEECGIECFDYFGCTTTCSATCEQEGSGTGGDPSPPPPPDSGDPYDPGFGCEDTSGILCDNGGGGDGNPSQPQDPDGDGEQDPCDTVSPDELEQCQPDPEPCDTGDPVIDAPSVQQEMEELWEESFGTDSDPLPHDQRNEGMFMVTATQSGYEISQIPPGPETSSCHFDADNVSVPSNIAALIHTHPYSDGDTITDPRCPSGTYNGDIVSSGDENLMQLLNSRGFNIPMYVMDKDKIRDIQPSNPSTYDESINRCGY